MLGICRSLCVFFCIPRAYIIDSLPCDTSLLKMFPCPVVLKITCTYIGSVCLFELNKSHYSDYIHSVAKVIITQTQMKL
ncbi:RNA-binding (RRM/RBD/RNP motifs) family protein [Zea mays]|uniref:RNA-binding (RRM/RBD/RNP motifs) family protein n=1 Tax=Zea mays TaxID=4577 RepID=A0A1D6HI44_MAIZE|nr:RNA-binding (RRM/RBD/RNP motifs) family protein [Zea mays]